MTDSSARAPASSRTGIPIWVSVMGALSCLGLGVAVGAFARGNQPSMCQPTASASAPSVDARVPEPSPLALAASGDHAAMEALAAIDAPKRSLQQGLALSQGRAAEKQDLLEQLRKKLATSESLENIKALGLFAQDPDTTRDAVGIAAGLRSGSGCDLLYELATLRTTPHEVANLCWSYLESLEVRGKSTPALSIVLELREADSCERRKTLLEKALQVGDKRLVRHIVPLTKKTGCGPKKSDDCNPCLREANQRVIRDALAAVQSRKSPVFCSQEQAR